MSWTHFSSLVFFCVCTVSLSLSLRVRVWKYIFFRHLLCTSSTSSSSSSTRNEEEKKRTVPEPIIISRDKMCCCPLYGERTTSFTPPILRNPSLFSLRTFGSLFFCPLLPFQNFFSESLNRPHARFSQTPFTTAPALSSSRYKYGILGQQRDIHLCDSSAIHHWQQVGRSASRFPEKFTTCSTPTKEKLSSSSSSSSRFLFFLINTNISKVFVAIFIFISTFRRNSSVLCLGQRSSAGQ